MKIVKYIILAVLAIAGVCIGAVSFLQRDIAAWHPAVAGADLPAVIPVRDFGRHGGMRCLHQGALWLMRGPS